MQLIDKILSVVPEGYILNRIKTVEPASFFRATQKQERLINGTITCWVTGSYVRTSSTTARSLYVDSAFAVTLDWSGEIQSNLALFPPKFYWESYSVEFDPTFETE